MPSDYDALRSIRRQLTAYDDNLADFVASFDRTVRDLAETTRLFQAHPEDADLRQLARRSFTSFSMLADTHSNALAVHRSQGTLDLLTNAGKALDCIASWRSMAAEVEGLLGQEEAANLLNQRE